MAVFEGTIYSSTLEMMTSLTVTMPDIIPDTGKGLPVITLLHGLSDNHSTWLRRTNVERYASDAGFAVVMPEVQRSFYADMAHGGQYFTYVAKELPVLCRKLFRFSDRREDNFIAGLSMGGYGAMKTAFTFPEQYTAVGCFSGAVDLERRLYSHETLMIHDELKAIMDGELLPENNLFKLAERFAEKTAGNTAAPKLYLTCGETDFMIEDNRCFHQHLSALHIPHDYEEWPGCHEWDFWDTSIRKAIGRFQQMLGR